MDTQPASFDKVDNQLSAAQSVTIVCPSVFKLGSSLT